MSEFFGYKRNKETLGQLATSDASLLTIKDEISLAQSVDIQYRQIVKPIFEVGTANMYYVAGHAEGTLSASKLVGDSPLTAFKGQSCGKIDTASFNAKGQCDFGGGGKVSITGAIIEQVGVNATAQALEMTESVQIRFSELVI